MARKLKIGEWWYTDFRHNGKRIRRRLSKNEIQAEKLFQDLLAVRQSSKDGTQPKNVSWFYFCEQVLDWYHENRNQQTYKKIRIALETIERVGRPIRHLSEMTPEYMGDFLKRWNKIGRDRETALDYLRRVKTAIKWAEARDMVTIRNWSLIEMPPYASRVEYFDFDELYRLLDATRDHWKTAAVLMAYAGLRSGEVRHLEWKDIDFKNRYIHVRAKTVRLPDGSSVYWEPKESEPNKPHNRTVDMITRVEDHLKSLPHDSNFVLGSYVPLNTYRQFFGRITKRMKFKVYAHKFRHTYASLMVSSGCTLEKLKVLMGHKDIRSTEIYGHLMPHVRRTAVDQMEAFLPPVPGPKFEVLSVQAGV